MWILIACIASISTGECKTANRAMTPMSEWQCRAALTMTTSKIKAWCVMPDGSIVRPDVKPTS